jgi:hypothetical protein
VSPTEPCILIGIHDIAVPRLLPRIACLFMAVFAELACAVHGFTELTNHLLGTLCTETRIAPLCPLLPALFAGPFCGTTAYPVMALDQITPQASGFTTRRRERAPFRRCVRQPMYFYRAIAHAMSIERTANTNHQKLVALAGQRVFHPPLNASCSSGSTACEAW